MKCEICNKKLKKSFTLGNVPLADNLKKNKQDSLRIKKYPVTIFHCKNCQTLFQKKVINKKKLFHKEYHYRPRFTKDVLDGMKSLVQKIKKLQGIDLREKKILDIGCNDGSLLNFFEKEGCKTYGIEPTNAGLEASKTHKVVKDFFNIKTAKYFVKNFGYPDIIVFTNVFAHIENINQLINSLKILLNKKKVILVIENHYLLSVLKKFQFDTFYHEHLRTYSLNSFFKISQKLEMNLFKYEFPKRYGGNIRVFMKRNKFSQNKISKINLVKLLNEKKEINKNLFLFRKRINSWIKLKLNFFKDINKKFGPIQAKTYPARASLIINILKLNSKNISNIYEKPGSKKIGYYVPGTDIKIISDKDIKNKKIPLINFSWHIKNEIKKYMILNNYKGKILNII
jgi:SAM-dependent methyltransferase